MPFKLICSSNTSRVVPAISVTIARSLPTSAFNKEDFPAFGFPTITVLIPSFKRLPFSEDAIIWFIFCISFSIIIRRFSPYPSILICSGSSKADSINAISCMILPRISLIFPVRAPFNCCMELFNAKSFFEEMTSMTDSAWLKSIRPFKNARLVNSPGSAGLAPFFSTTSKIRRITSVPPWQSISTVSSLV